MKKILMVLWALMMVSGPAASAFGAYASTNENNTIDWYNIIEGFGKRDYRSVSSRSHTPFHFSFNGFDAEEGASYEMTLRPRQQQRQQAGTVGSLPGGG
jgi:hypothetical protein